MMFSSCKLNIRLVSLRESDLFLVLHRVANSLSMDVFYVQPPSGTVQRWRCPNDRTVAGKVPDTCDKYTVGDSILAIISRSTIALSWTACASYNVLSDVFVFKIMHKFTYKMNGN